MDKASAYRMMLDLVADLDGSEELGEIFDLVPSYLDRMGLSFGNVSILNDDGTGTVVKASDNFRYEALNRLLRPFGVSFNYKGFTNQVRDTIWHDIYYNGKTLATENVRLYKPWPFVYRADFNDCLLEFFKDTALEPLIRRFGMTPFLRAVDTDHIVLAPFGADGSVIGALMVAGSLRKPVVDDHIELLDAFCRIVGGSCSRVRKRQEAERARRELTRSEERFRLVVENASEIILVVRGERAEVLNPKSVERFNWDLEKVSARNFLEFIAPEDRDKVEELYRALLAGAGGGVAEIRIFDPDGRPRWMEIKYSSLRLEDSPAALCIMLDVTDRRAAEDALRESEARLKAVMDNSGSLISVKDLDGRYRMANRGFLAARGLGEEEVIGRTDAEVFGEGGAAELSPKEREVLAGGKPVEFDEEIDIGGEARTFITIKFPLLGQGGKIYSVCSISTDITERKRLEAELIKADKLESVGQLSGGIAHDFNNILMGILSNINLVMYEDKIGGDARKLLGEAEKACHRARDLTQQLLTFSKGGEPILETIDVETPLRENASFALRGSNAACSFDIDPDLRPVKADPGQLAQIISNIVMNADQAMPEGGTVRVEARNVSAENDLPPSLEPGEYVRLSFRDEGVGIDEKHLARIFDPYFTTKQKGSGLGLATAYSIARKHGGGIFAESNRGAGTTFIVYLRASDKDVKIGKERRLVMVPGGGGKVLVMDDEEMIRNICARVLARAGFRVELAAGGEQALDLYVRAMRDGFPFDLVIMDLTVPGGMGGKEAIKRLLDIDPAARAIVASGYSNDPVLQNYREYGFLGMVKKPFTPDDLYRVINEVLERDRDRKAGLGPA